jgi:hypothetical protein
LREVGEEPVEKVGSVVLALGCGVVVLGLQGGSELAGLKEGQVSQIASKAQSSSAGRMQWPLPETRLGTYSRTGHTGGSNPLRKALSDRGFATAGSR